MLTWHLTSYLLYATFVSGMHTENTNFVWGAPISICSLERRRLSIDDTVRPYCIIYGLSKIERRRLSKIERRRRRLSKIAT